MEQTHWFGNTILRLDKINAIQHNSNKDLGPTNNVTICLDDAIGSKIEVVFMDFDHAAQSVENLREILEIYLNK